MKALVLQEYNRLVYQEVPKPEPGPGEVCIRVKACGICGSDFHGMDGSTGRRVPPVIMGHEAAGVVTEVGPGVTGFGPGDRVTFDSTLYCGNCRYCRQGRINLCDHRQVLGVSCAEFHRDGALAEYVIVPERVVYRLPDSLSFEKAAMVEPVSIAVHGASLTPIRLNDSALVVGCGVIGLLVIQALRLSGCGRIMAVDLDPGRLEMARDLGADVTLPAGKEPVPEKVLDLTGGSGVDLAFDVVGNQAAFESALGGLKKGGHLTLIGNLVPRVDLPLQAVVSRQVSLQGSCASSGQYATCLDLIANGRILVDPLISKVAPLSEGAKWFKALYQGTEPLLKVILTP
jgi:L-iditol 2-dehydrogenase